LNVMAKCRMPVNEVNRIDNPAACGRAM